MGNQGVYCLRSHKSRKLLIQVIIFTCFIDIYLSHFFIIRRGKEYGSAFFGREEDYYLKDKFTQSTSKLKHDAFLIYITLFIPLIYTLLHDLHLLLSMFLYLIMVGSPVETRLNKIGVLVRFIFYENMSK